MNAFFHWFWSAPWQLELLIVVIVVLVAMVLAGALASTR